MTNLKTYRVRFAETIIYEIDVEAEDEDQAEDTAMETVFAMPETDRVWHIVDGGGTSDYEVAEIAPEEVTQ